MKLFSFIAKLFSPEPTFNRFGPVWITFQFNIPFHDPVTRAEAEAIQAKLNEVIATMHT